MEVSINGDPHGWSMENPIIILYPATISPCHGPGRSSFPFPSAVSGGFCAWWNRSDTSLTLRCHQCLYQLMGNQWLIINTG